MTNREAFILVSNQDAPAGEHGPRHSVVVFSRDGTVAEVYRYRRAPSEAEVRDVLAQHPGCLHVVIEAGSCQLERTLGRAIRRQLRQANP